MPKPKPRSAARVTVDALLVAHAQRAHGPAHAMLREMLPEVQEIRAAWRPQLDIWARHPWPTWHTDYFVPNLGPEVQALAARLAGVEAAVAAWYAQVQALTPRTAWRFGPALRRQARGLRHEPTLLLLALHKLRERVAEVERTRARYGPAAVVAARPPAWMVRDPSELRAVALTPAKRDFDPLRVGR